MQRSTDVAAGSLARDGTLGAAPKSDLSIANAENLKPSLTQRDGIRRGEQVALATDNRTHDFQTGHPLWTADSSEKPQIPRQVFQH